MKLTRARLLTLGVISTVSSHAQAEGSSQFGLNQPYQDFSANGNKPLYVDVQTAGEIINFAFCGSGSGSVGDTGVGDSITINVFAPGADHTADPAIATNTGTGNISCDDALNTPLNPATLFQVDTTSHGAGTFIITIENNASDDIDRLDISVTPNSATFPDPTALAGRLWAYSWSFYTGTFAESESTDADYFALIPGGRPNTNYVWKLDLNNFSGNYYTLVANNLGVDAPNSGYSIPTANGSVTEKYSLYLGYPAVANDRPTDPPVLSDFTFTDDAGQDYAISPASTNGFQDSGNFTFTSDVEGTYAITIDTNSDGVYGANDRLLLGEMVIGTNTVAWDGTDTDGVTVVGNGQYRAQLQARLGEYHFVANDAETSGGTEDGLTIFLANSDGSTTDTTVFWDDQTYLAGTSNLPNGASSSTPAGRHTWGNFTSGGIGDQSYIDTYVYGASSFYSAIAAVVADDTLQTGVDGTISADATSSITSGGFTITVTDADNNVLSGSVESVTVVVSNGTTGELEQVTLTETAANSGIFTATLATTNASGAGTDNDGNMNVQYGDVLTSSYSDQLDSAGASQTVTATTTITAGSASAAESTISAGPASIVANGSSTSTVTVQLKDASGNDLTSSGGTVTLTTDQGSLSNITDQGDGTYTATLTSSTSVTTATITGTLDGTAISDSATVAFTLNPAGDDDGDGIPNGDEESTDRDGDGIAGYLDRDSDNDGIPDQDEGNVDSDGDSVPDFLDLDSDNDGLFDLVEAGHASIASPATLDADSDGRIDSGFGSNGLADAVETSADSNTIAYTIADTDGDGVEDFRDLDSDNDGLTDLVESAGTDPDNNGMLGSGIPSVDADGLATGYGITPLDSDSDSVFNHHDLDSDNDTITDVLEAEGNDADNDGILGSGAPTVNALGLPAGAPLTEQDTDNDGLPDQVDVDADNDGVNDIIEVGGTDNNDDGRVDSFNDVDGDGWDDGVANNGGTGTPVDTDNDGTPDYKDADDTDGDGIFDAVDLDDDNDGIPDVNEGSDAVDSDGDGIADSRDLDSDNDGLFDLVESGIASVGTLDANDDGMIDSNFGTNGLADAVETAADSGAIGYTLLDSDADTVANFRDLDSDNDGLTDIAESFGNDPDDNGQLGNGIPAVDSMGLANGAGLAPVDTDNDGLTDPTDVDSDNDGYFDVAEAGGADTDNDGFVGDGNEAANVDSSGLPSVGPLTALDTDNDGVEDQRDLDSDNDGLSDVIEAGGSDPDNDGIIGTGTPTVNALGQPDNGPLVEVDTDNDGTPNQRDLDSDNDGVNDIREFGFTDQDDNGEVDGFSDIDGDGRDDASASSQLPPLDTDNDGTPDFRDADDTDGDGVFDAVDLDDDNDGIPDVDEGDGSVDTDADGIPDSRDLDSDNDGLFDVTEAGIGSLQDIAALDADNNGQIDGAVGSNGLADAVETAVDSDLLNYSVIDTDSDLTADFRDLDSDNDGTFDVTEAGGPDPDGNGLIGTGNPPTVNALGIAGGSMGTPVDTDNDGLPDFQDIDANGNGIPDNQETEAEIQTGVDGIGGCSAVSQAPFDPTLPTIFLAALMYTARQRLRSIVFGEKNNEEK